MNLIKKIYSRFDFDGDGKLDRIEMKALLDNLSSEITQNNASLNLLNLKESFK
jgi:Ca2+-binding EF-hand superfamily protein